MDCTSSKERYLGGEHWAECMSMISRSCSDREAVAGDGDTIAAWAFRFLVDGVLSVFSGWRTRLFSLRGVCKLLMFRSDDFFPAWLLFLVCEQPCAAEFVLSNVETGMIFFVSSFLLYCWKKFFLCFACKDVPPLTGVIFPSPGFELSYPFFMVRKLYPMVCDDIFTLAWNSGDLVLLLELSVKDDCEFDDENTWINRIWKSSCAPLFSVSVYHK